MHKTILITGATRGLGLSLARAYRKRGHFVIGLARDSDALARLQEQGVLCDTIKCDLADMNQIDLALLHVDRQYEQLDLLIHNAAIQSAYDICESSHYALMTNREMSVNFLAPVKLSAGLLPHLLESKGQIAVITSLLQRVSKPTAPGYGASKAALANWLANLRYQLRDHEVGVCEVVPGLLRTGMSPEGMSLGRDPDELAEIIVNRLPDRRIVLPGARLGWFLGNTAPGLLQGLLNRK